MTTTTHLMRLLVRSKVFRILIISVAITVFFGVFSTTVSSALKLSPTQTADKLLGSANALVDSPGGEEAVSTPGNYPADYHFDIASTKAYSAIVDLRDESGQLFTLQYQELPLPSAPVQDRVELINGTWTSTAGECVSTLGSGVFTSTFGKWKLHSIGTARNIFTPSASIIWCAPGTWKLWQDIPANSNSGANLSTSYYFSGNSEAIDSYLEGLAAKKKIPAYSIVLRTSIDVPDNGSATDFLSVQALSTALLIAVPWIFSGRLSRWTKSVQSVLVQSGIASSLLLKASFLALSTAVLSAGLLAAFLAVIAAWAVRPLLVMWNNQVPLSSWSFPLSTLIGSLSYSLLGAVAGFGLGAWREAQEIRSAYQAQPLSPRDHRQIKILTIALAALSLALLITSNGWLWQMAIGVVVGIFASAMLAPLAGLLFARLLSKFTGSPTALAGRLVLEDSKRWSLMLVSITLIMGIVVSIFINMSASVVAQSKLLDSAVPRGMALVEVPDNSANDTSQVLKDMEQTTGLTHSAEIHQTSLRISGQGVLFTFSSEEQALTVLGSLEPDAREALSQGKILRPGGPAGQVTFDIGDSGSQYTAAVHPYRPEPTHRLSLGYGYAIMPKELEHNPAVQGAKLWVFTDLDDVSAEKLRLWPSESGNNLITVYSYHAEEGSIPLRMALGFSALVLAAIPLLVWSMRKEIETLRPLVAALHSTGIPPAWSRSVLLAIGGLQLFIPLSCATLAALTTTGILQLLYPPIYDVAGANWLGVAALTFTLVISVLITAQWAVTKAHQKIRQSVI